MPLPTIGSQTSLGTPRDFVLSGWEYFRNLGATYIDLSKQATADLTNFNIVPIEFDATLDLNVDYSTFTRPVKPELEDLGTVDVTLPTAPTVQDVALRNLGDAPSEPDFSSLRYSPPSAPNAPQPDEPTDVTPVLDAITIPDAPTVTLPDLPTLYSLNLPDPPSITIPEFTATRPDVDLDAWIPDRNLDWRETAYSSTLLDAIKSRLADMLAGGLGLPVEVEQQLFDRGRDRADRETIRRVQEVADELGSRGLTEPSGYLAGRLDEAREQGRRVKADYNRDITIEVAKIQVESVRTALSQGAALEIALLQENGQINARALQAAQIAAEIQKAVFEAIVTRYNLDVELFKADAEVFRDRIQAAIAQAELYKAQIDAQKVVGDINEGLLRAYTEQVRSISVLADLYTAQVNGARAAAEVNTQRIEQARLKVQLYGQKIEAWKQLNETYRVQVDAALGNVKVFEAIGDVYGKRVEAYRTKGQAYLAEANFGLEQQRLNFTGFGASLDAARTLITAQSAAVDARARKAAAQATLYQSEGAVVAAESAAQDRNVQARIAAAQARFEALAKSIDARMNQNVQVAGLYLEAIKAKAQVVNQLAAATLSGVNFGASFSGSMGVSTGYSASFGYSGDTSDLDPPYLPYVSF